MLRCLASTTMNLGISHLTRTFAARCGVERDKLRRAVNAELVATMREAALLPYDLTPIVPATGAGDDVVVLIHGFLATAGAFRPMRKALERRGSVKVATFTHAPGASVRRIASKLAEVVEGLHPAAKVHLVGHSLGGVAARWYVQELGGHRKVEQTISLASPFGGAKVARRVPWFVGAELHEKSTVLSRLRARAPRVRVPHLSIVAGADHLVGPANSAAFAVGDVVVLEGRGHNMLLFDDDVVDLILQRLTTAERAAA